MCPYRPSDSMHCALFATEQRPPFISGAAMTASLDSNEALQRQIEQLQTQLRDAQQLTALGELLSTTTHEFNNVLTTVINYAKLGLRYTDEPSRTKAFDR